MTSLSDLKPGDRVVVYGSTGYPQDLGPIAVGRVARVGKRYLVTEDPSLYYDLRDGRERGLPAHYAVPWTPELQAQVDAHRRRCRVLSRLHRWVTWQDRPDDETIRRLAEVVGVT